MAGKSKESKNGKTAEGAFPRRFGVVLEDIDSKLGLVAEGHQALEKKIDENHREFREFRSEINYKFEMVFDELHLIRNDLKVKVSRDEFLALEKRVIALERKRP
ncbi:MAG: hypothetical protein AAB560_00600 [Patescibacteria group bacterium]